MCIEMLRPVGLYESELHDMSILSGGGRHDDTSERNDISTSTRPGFGSFWGRFIERVIPRLAPDRHSKQAIK